MGHPTFTTLDGDEIFAIGKLAIKYQEPHLAIEWMNATAILKTNKEKNYEAARTKVAIVPRILSREHSTWFKFFV